MLTRNVRLNGTTIDPAEAVRSARDATRDLRVTARDLQAPDARDLRKAIDKAMDDVPDRIEDAIEAANESLREAGESLRAAVHDLTAPQQRSRMPSAGAWLAGVAFMIAAVALGAWLFRRMSSSAVDELDLDVSTLDRDDLDRAAGEGMGTAPGAAERRMGTSPNEGLLSPLDAPRENSGIGLTGVMADPATTGERSGLAEPQGASANGVGTASDRYPG
jgi:hypothetical protein